MYPSKDWDKLKYHYIQNLLSSYVLFAEHSEYLNGENINDVAKKRAYDFLVYSIENPESTNKKSNINTYQQNKFKNETVFQKEMRKVAEENLKLTYQDIWFKKEEQKLVEQLPLDRTDYHIVKEIKEKEPGIFKKAVEYANTHLNTLF